MMLFDPTSSAARECAPLPWHERAFLTVDEAAEVFARSAEWVHVVIADGELETVRQRRNGSKLICVESALRLRDRMHQGTTINGRDAAAFRPSRPRLVWTNPNL